MDILIIPAFLIPDKTVPSNIRFLYSNYNKNVSENNDILSPSRLTPDNPLIFYFCLDVLIFSRPLPQFDEYVLW